MRKALKWIGIGVAAVLGVAALTAAYLVATFDPNDYRSYIIQAVHDRTGRTLKLEGDIALSFFPTLGARLGAASLSEPRSDREFASVGDARVSMKLLPLLRGEAIVDAVEVKGLRAVIERDQAGRFNFSDLTGAEKTPPDQRTATPVKVDIARIEISDADVTYVDRAAGARYRLANLDLKTGRIADGVTTPVDFSATVFSDAHKAKLDTRLRSRLTFELERERYRLDGLDFSAKGNWGAFSAVDASAKGRLEANLATSELAAEGLTAAFKAKQPDGALTARLEAPRLVLTEKKVDGAKVTLEVNREQRGERLAARVLLPAVQGASEAVKAGPLDAHLEMRSDARTVKARLNGTLAGNLKAQRFELQGLTLNAVIVDPAVAGGAMDAALTGSARADLQKETAALDFSGKLDQSQVSGRAGITRLTPLALTFDVSADRLDMDRLLGRPAPATQKQQAKVAAGGAGDKPLDLSGLKGIDATGAVKIGQLTLMNIQSSQVRADLRIAGGRLEANPVSAQLYQGNLKGSFSAQASADPVFTIRQNLSGIAVGPLLRDAAQIDTLEGRGSVTANLTARGATADALKKGLNGTLAVSLADGSIKGMDIANTVRTVRARVSELRGQKVEQSDMAQKTDFTELKASFNVKNGVARNDDLAMKSPLLRAAGAGDIDIANERLNYTLKATLVASLEGQGGREVADLRGLTVPVHLTGALAAPRYSIDFAGMVTDLAGQRLQDEIAKRAGGALPAKPGGASPEEAVRDIVKDRLKGLFGR
jgi:AsmA protein